jgi:hypothetical protein
MFDSTPVTGDANQSGVSWGAVIAGAFVAAALTLALLALGAGIGFSETSPWASAGASSSKIGWTAVVWLVLIETVASSIGGYLAGRLRAKWVNVHSHETYFRDTAHGFLVWAVGLVIAVAFLTSAATSMLGGSGWPEASAAGSASIQGKAGATGYFVDLLLRPSASNFNQDASYQRTEIEGILANGLREKELPAADKSYLAQVVAARSGVNQPEAERKVDDVFAQTQQSVERARKAAAHSMYWTFLALLVGAFAASYAATIGGSQRDRVPAV